MSDTDYNFNMTANQIVKRVFNMLNIYAPTEEVEADDLKFALDGLNLLVKEWQADGLHLWVKETGTLFLQANRNHYELLDSFLITPSDRSQSATNYFVTELSSNAVAIDTTVTVGTTIGMAVNDFIGIESVDGGLLWKKVTNVLSPTSVEFTPALEVDASAGAIVYYYAPSKSITTPFNVYSAVRQQKPIEGSKQSLIRKGSAVGTDTLMNQISYQEYFELPLKDSTGIPVSYNYDRQLGKAVIRVWPTPSNVNYLMKLTYARQLKDIDGVTDYVEFPQEWLNAVIDNLAVRLAPAYGKANDNNFALLQNNAKESYQRVLSFDSEQGSLFLQPNYDGYRGYRGYRSRGR